jgi:hypothetical protein
MIIKERVIMVRVDINKTVLNFSIQDLFVIIPHPREKYATVLDDDDVYLDKLQTKGVKKYILYM